MSWSASINRAFDGLGDLLSDLCGGHLELPALDAHQGRYWQSFSALRQRLEDGNLSIAVLALTKSGKSTLLNALIGEHLLPMNNVPETARICKIVHPSPGSQDAHVAPPEPYLLEPVPSAGKPQTLASPTVVTARGREAVRRRLQQLNAATRSGDRGPAGFPLSPSLSSTGSLSQGRRPSLTPALSSGLPSRADPWTAASGDARPSATQGDGAPDSADCNLPQLPDPRDPPVATGLASDKVLSICTPVAALLQHEAAAGQLENMRLELIDTPGPNEAGEEGLKHQVERVLDSVGAVLYLLDYTKLKTQDEAAMFDRLRTVNPALMNRLSQRLFFAVNKMDAAEVSEGQDAESTREYVAQLVTQQLGVPGFRLKPSQVILLSARNALLSRLVLGGAADAEARSRFLQLAFGRFVNPATVTQEQMQGAAAALLQESGILELERQVLGFLYDHAFLVKHLSLVDDLGRLIQEILNVGNSCAAALSTSANALTACMANTREQLDSALAAFEQAQQVADAMGDLVVGEVCTQLQTLRCRLFSAIIHALDTSGGTNVHTGVLPSFSGDMAASAVQEATINRRWWAVRDRFMAMFTSSSSLPPRPPGLGVSGVDVGVRYYSSGSGGEGAREDVLNAAGHAVARSRSKAELASLLLNLHEDLTAQIHADVREFWGQVETLAAARHAKLLSSLNEHLACVSKQVEGVISANLGVQLSPVEIKLCSPDAVQFHDNLEDLLSAGMVETRERHIRVNQREVQERVRRQGGGICRWGEYWETVPRMRTVVEAYTLTTYELVPERITDHFIRMVDQAIDATQSSLATYVHDFVNQELAAAREQLRQYSASYLDSMTASLEAHAQGSEHRLAALSQVQSFLQRLKDLAANRDELQASMERALPVAAVPDGGSDFGDEHFPELESEDAPEEHDHGKGGAGTGCETPAGRELASDQDRGQGEAGPVLPSAPVAPTSTTTPFAATALASPFAIASGVLEPSPAPVTGHNDPRHASPHETPSKGPLPVQGGVEWAGASEGAPVALGGLHAEDPDAGGTSIAPPPLRSSSPPLAALLPAQPFDYASGFVTAMSRSKLEGEGQEGLGGQNHQAMSGSQDGSASEEWDLVNAE